MRWPARPNNAGRSLAYAGRVIPQTRQPQPYRRPDRLPFAQGDGWRPLRLVLDDDSLEGADRDLLLAFADADEIELTRTAPDALPRLEPRPPQEDFVPIHKLTPSDGAGFFWVSDAARLAERARRVAEAGGVDEQMAWRAIVLCEAAEECEADGFVTARTFLLREGSSSGPAVYTVEEALALIGLALRLRGNTSIGSDLLNLRLEGRMFHFVLGRELLAAGWRWFSGCVAHSHATGDDTALNLGQAAQERFMRALQIRDRLHAQAKIPQKPAVGDELVFQFETLLLFLSASFDATARIAHLVYLGRNYEDAGWRRGDWQKKLATAAPALASLVAPGTPGAAVMGLVSRLRNTIHGEAMRSIDVRRSGQPPQSLVALSAAETEKLVVEIERLGDEAREWGLTVEPTRTRLAVDAYTEALLPNCVKTLNDLMAATEVERLPSVDPTRLMGPPANVTSANPISNMFNFEIRRRVRLLGGFD